MFDDSSDDDFNINSKPRKKINKFQDSDEDL